VRRQDQLQEIGRHLIAELAFQRVEPDTLETAHAIEEGCGRALRVELLALAPPRPVGSTCRYPSVPEAEQVAM